MHLKVFFREPEVSKISKMPTDEGSESNHEESGEVSSSTSNMITTNMMTSIPKLETNNYQSWIEMMGFSLELQGLEVNLRNQGSEKQKKQAQLLLLRSMDENHRKKVRGCTSPQEILRRLEMIYNDRSAANAHRLLVQYYRFVKKPEESMSAYI